MAAARRCAVCCAMRSDAALRASRRRTCRCSAMTDRTERTSKAQRRRTARRPAAPLASSAARSRKESRRTRLASRAHARATYSVRRPARARAARTPGTADMRRSRCQRHQPAKKWAALLSVAYSRSLGHSDAKKSSTARSSHARARMSSALIMPMGTPRNKLARETSSKFCMMASLRARGRFFVQTLKVASGSWRRRASARCLGKPAPVLLDRALVDAVLQTDVVAPAEALHAAA